MLHTICPLILVNILYFVVLGKIDCIVVDVLMEPLYVIVLALRAHPCFYCSFGEKP